VWRALRSQPTSKTEYELAKYCTQLIIEAAARAI